MTDTIKLLRECNAGIKMGESAIKQVLPHAKNDDMKRALEMAKDTHASLGDETHSMLIKNNADTKDPHAIARAMSSMKIYAKMTMNESDRQIAHLMTDGCNMGIKSLSHYLNQYKYADDKAKSLAKRLIASEENLEERMRTYL